MKYTIYVFLVVVLFVALPALAQNLQEGLIAYWNFDGKADDSSGNKYNGTITGKPPFVAGRFGQAISFGDAGNYVAVENNDDIKLRSTGKYSVSVYVNPNTTKHGDILYHGLGCSTWASWFLGMAGAEPDAPLVADNFIFGVRTSNGSAYTAVSSPATAGEWTHVVATFDGGDLKLYLDAVEVKKQSTKDIPYDSQEKLHIGGDPGCGGRSWYDGLLDEVRLYDRALTEREIAMLKEGGLAVNLSGKLAATWGEIKEQN